MNRTQLASLTLSAAALVGIALHEGYSPVAYTPVPGDVPTIGFGTTEGVKLGDKITPPQALARALTDIQKHIDIVLNAQIFKVCQLTMRQFGIGVHINKGTIRFMDQTRITALAEDLRCFEPLALTFFPFVTKDVLRDRSVIHATRN